MSCWPYGSVTTLSEQKEPLAKTLVRTAGCLPSHQDSSPASCDELIGSLAVVQGMKQRFKVMVKGRLGFTALKGESQDFALVLS